MLADPCADPGIFARGVQARLPEHSSDNVFFFFFVLNFYCFTVASLWFISKKAILLQGFGGGEGCPTFSRRVQPFLGGIKLFPRGGGGGANANSRNP